MASRKRATSDDQLTNDDAGDLYKLSMQWQLHKLEFPILDFNPTAIVRSRYSTPPAALSSLGARMAEHSASGSISSLDDAYDMVDDVSDFSSDEHDTVSLASTNNRGEEEVEEEHDMEGSMNGEVDEQIPMEDDHTPTEIPMLSQNQAFKVRLPFYNGLVASTNSEHLLDESMGELLETPVQSIITIKAVSPVESTIVGDSSHATPHSPATIPETKKHTGAWKTRFWKARDGDAFKTLPGYLILLSQLMLWSYVFLVWFTPTIDLADSQQSYNSTESISELHTSLQHFIGAETFDKHINYTHLLPEPIQVGTSLLGFPMYGTRDIRYQALAPNHLLISLPQLPSITYPTPVTLVVKRGIEDVQANRTQLTKGVHIVTVDPKDAHGVLSVSMACKRPDLAVSIAHDFGSRLLHLNTYEKACTDLSKILAKDVAIARHVAKAVSDNIHDDFEAGVRVAQSKLKSKSHELSLLAGQASRSLQHAEKAGLVLVTDVKKELVAVQKHFQDTYDNVFDAFKSLIPSVEAIKQPIMLARERSLIISQKVREKHELARSNRAKTKALKKQKRADARKVRDMERVFCRNNPEDCHDGARVRSCSG